MNFYGVLIDVSQAQYVLDHEIREFVGQQKKKKILSK